ncbi:hypothetical protein ABPG74_005330 [Tetrahymena malaccensis]
MKKELKILTNNEQLYQLDQHQLQQECKWIFYQGSTQTGNQINLQHDQQKLKREISKDKEQNNAKINDIQKIESKVEISLQSSQKYRKDQFTYQNLGEAIQEFNSNSQMTSKLSDNSTLSSQENSRDPFTYSDKQNKIFQAHEQVNFDKEEKEKDGQNQKNLTIKKKIDTPKDEGQQHRNLLATTNNLPNTLKITPQDNVCDGEKINSLPERNSNNLCKNSTCNDMDTPTDQKKEIQERNSILSSQEKQRDQFTYQNKQNQIFSDNTLCNFHKEEKEKYCQNQKDKAFQNQIDNSNDEGQQHITKTFELTPQDNVCDGEKIISLSGNNFNNLNKSSAYNDMDTPTDQKKEIQEDNSTLSSQENQRDQFTYQNKQNKIFSDNTLYNIRKEEKENDCQNQKDKAFKNQIDNFNDEGQQHITKAFELTPQDNVCDGEKIISLSVNNSNNFNKSSTCNDMDTPTDQKKEIYEGNCILYSQENQRDQFTYQNKQNKIFSDNTLYNIRKEEKEKDCQNQKDKAFKNQIDNSNDEGQQHITKTFELTPQDNAYDGTKINSLPEKNSNNLNKNSTCNDMDTPTDQPDNDQNIQNSQQFQEQLKKNQNLTNNTQQENKSCQNIFKKQDIQEEKLILNGQKYNEREIQSKITKISSKQLSVLKIEMGDQGYHDASLSSIKELLTKQTDLLYFYINLENSQVTEEGFDKNILQSLPSRLQILSIDISQIRGLMISSLFEKILKSIEKQKDLVSLKLHMNYINGKSSGEPSFIFQSNNQSIKNLTLQLDQTYEGDYLAKNISNFLKNFERVQKLTLSLVNDEMDIQSFETIIESIFHPTSQIQCFVLILNNKMIYERLSKIKDKLYLAKELDILRIIINNQGIDDNNKLFEEIKYFENPNFKVFK